MLALLACSAEAGFRQGVSSRSVKPQPRGKPSGRPFAARFTDVAAAGRTDTADRLRRHRPKELHHRSGRMRRGVSRLRQRRLARSVRPERHPSRRGAAGYHQSPLQEQSRRHVHGCHGEGGPDPHRLGIGGDRRRLRQRRFRGSVHHLLRAQRAVSEQRRRHVHRCDGQGRSSAGAGAIRLGVHVGRLRPRWSSRSVRRDLPGHDARETAQAR